jgi:selenide,water dikinase
VKKNNTAQVGDVLYLTKPLGIGIITTAQKKNLVSEEDLREAKKWMLTLNSIGFDLGTLDYVHALTDVTGFGLAGHLLEVCEGSGVGAELYFDSIPVLNCVPKYLELGSVPGGTNRNWKTYGHKFRLRHDDQFKILADPQTSGGLLVCVDPKQKQVFEEMMKSNGLDMEPIGEILAWERGSARISVK